MKLIDEVQLTYDDLIVFPNAKTDISSRFSKEVYPYINLGFPALPIMNAPMNDSTSLKFIELVKHRIADVFTSRFLPFETQLEHISAGASPVIGLNTTNEELSRILEAGNVKTILLDVAHGSSLAVIEKLRSLQYLRESDIYLVGGNIATFEGYKSLIGLVDQVRVGIGGGAACTTRINTGIGAGTPNTLLQCRQYIEDSACQEELPELIADGGCSTNGDIIKALACGAHYVMLGKMFARTWEAGDGVQPDGNKIYRGMASSDFNSTTSIEGKAGKVATSGSVTDLLASIDGNLRSAMSYIGAHFLEEIYPKSKLARVSHSFQKESNTNFNN